MVVLRHIGDIDKPIPVITLLNGDDIVHANPDSILVHSTTILHQILGYSRSTCFESNQDTFEAQYGTFSMICTGLSGEPKEYFLSKDKTVVVLSNMIMNLCGKGRDVDQLSSVLRRLL